MSRNVTEMAAMTRPFVFAWHFLTAIPISRSHHAPSSAELATSMAWYSTVGLLIGGFLAAADQGLRLFLAAEVVNVLLIVLLVLMTRGLHQDGLAVYRLCSRMGVWFIGCGQSFRFSHLVYGGTAAMP